MFWEPELTKNVQDLIINPNKDYLKEMTASDTTKKCMLLQPHVYERVMNVCEFV